MSKITEICQDIRCKNTAMRVILNRVNELCDKAVTEGMTDADYREVDELRFFVREFCRVPNLGGIDLLLNEYGRLFSEIGADLK